MKDPLLRFTLRIDRELFEKFRYITAYEERSANKDLVLYIKRKVKKFENENGPINTTEFFANK